MRNRSAEKSHRFQDEHFVLLKPDRGKFVNIGLWREIEFPACVAVLAKEDVPPASTAMGSVRRLRLSASTLASPTSFISFAGPFCPARGAAPGVMPGLVPPWPTLSE